MLRVQTQPPLMSSAHFSHDGTQPTSQVASSPARAYACTQAGMGAVAVAPTTVMFRVKPNPPCLAVHVVVPLCSKVMVITACGLDGLQLELVQTEVGSCVPE